MYTRSTQPCIPLGSLNRAPALIGGNVTSAGWQVTLCDPIWHVSSRSGAVLVARTAIRFFLPLPSLFALALDNEFDDREAVFHRSLHGHDSAISCTKLVNFRPV